MRTRSYVWNDSLRDTRLPLQMELGDHRQLYQMDFLVLRDLHMQLQAVTKKNQPIN